MEILNSLSFSFPFLFFYAVLFEIVLKGEKEKKTSGTWKILWAFFLGALALSTIYIYSIYKFPDAYYFPFHFHIREESYEFLCGGTK